MHTKNLLKFIISGFLRWIYSFGDEKWPSTLLPLTYFSKGLNINKIKTSLHIAFYEINYTSG
jgi:hypothetical protein